MTVSRFGRRILHAIRIACRMTLKETGMQFHQGRLIDHVHLRVSDLEASRRFYRAVLKALGHSFTSESPRHFSCDELWVDQADRESVHAFHQAALAHGGRDNGGPGERSYHPGYYAAFAFDPDGHNIEAVFHGPAERSTEAVVVTPKP
jgi:catechol 2,3-dioxygenase-like lactoylglutathione lyase family enzyme